MGSTELAIRQNFNAVRAITLPPQKLGQTLGGDFDTLGATWTARDSSRAWSKVAVSADGKYQTAVVTFGTIYTSSDFGVTWTSRDSSRNWHGISLSADGKYQTAVVSGGLIYISSDYGVTWTSKDSSRTWVAVSISADGKYQTAVVTTGTVYISSDFGATWTSKDSSRNWVNVAISADGKCQTAVVSTGQIYVSYDFGLTWAATGLSLAYTGIDVSANGKYQTAVVNTGFIYISSDYGATWIPKESSRDWNSVSISADGRYQTAVTLSVQIYASSDFGSTWTAKDSNRVWADIAVSADGRYQTGVVSSGQIYTSVNTARFEYHLLDLPTTDPLIIGALWSENGVVVRSQGGPSARFSSLIRRDTDFTTVSASFIDVPGMSFTFLAGHYYRLSGWLRITNDSDDASFVAQWAGTATATWLGGSSIAQNSATPALEQDDLFSLAGFCSGAVPQNFGAGSTHPNSFRAIMKVNAAGTLKIQIKRTGAGNAIAYTGSWAIAEDLGI